MNRLSIRELPRELDRKLCDFLAECIDEKLQVSISVTRPHDGAVLLLHWPPPKKEGNDND